MHLQSGILCRTLKFRNQRARMRFLIMQYSSILGECHLLVVSYTLRRKINLKGEIRPGTQVIGLLNVYSLWLRRMVPHDQLLTLILWILLIASTSSNLQLALYPDCMCVCV